MEKEKPTYNLDTIRFGMNDFGSSMIATMGITFFAIFMTNMVGVSAATVGWIISVAGIFDTISVPCLGFLIQKFHFKRGKFRPWILWGGLFCAICALLRFVDFGLQGTPQVVYYFLVYVVCQIGLNAVMSGYQSLIPVFGKTPEKRIILTSCSIQFNAIGKFLFGLTAVALIAFFSGGGEQTAAGYSGLAVLVAILSFAVFYQMYRLAGKVDLPAVKAEQTEKKLKLESDVSIMDMLKGIVHLPMLFFLIAGILKISTFFAINSIAPYYYQYVIGDKTMLTVFLSLSTVLMFIGATATPLVSKWSGGARNAYIIGAIVYGVAMLSSFIFKGSALGITSIICIGYIGYAFMHSSERTVYSTIVDYAQLKTGKDMKGFIMPILLLCPKIGTIFQGMILGIGLTAIGFDAAS